MMSMKHTMSAYGDSKSIVEWRRVRFDNTITLCRQKQQMIIARCHSRYPRVRAARRRRQRVVRARVEKKDVNVCVMVSGGGSNLKSLHRASVEGRLGGGTIKVHLLNEPTTQECIPTFIIIIIVIIVIKSYKSKHPNLVLF